jgi:hypothetical protein
MPLIARSLDYSVAQEYLPPEIEFPFEQNGDTTTILIRRFYKQTLAGYMADKLSARYPLITTLDAEYPTARLMAVSVPTSTPTGLATFTRTYASIPATQVTYSSRAITKPTIGNQAANTNFSVREITALSTETTTAVQNYTGLWTADNKVYGPYKAGPLSITAVYATAATFTLTYKTSTTAALAYSATIANICAALNALAAVIADGITFSAGANSLASTSGGTLFFNTSAPAPALVTMNTAGLTVSGGYSSWPAFTYRSDVAQQTINLGFSVSISSHGFSAGVPLLATTNITSGTTGRNHALRYAVGEWAVYDANVLAVMRTYDGAAGLQWSLFAPYRGPYTPGVATLNTRVTEISYLPGVTPGIATAADIPIVSPKLSDADLIAAILDETGYQPIDFDGPSRWLDGPIYLTRTTEIDLSDIT